MGSKFVVAAPKIRQQRGRLGRIFVTAIILLPSLPLPSRVGWGSWPFEFVVLRRSKAGRGGETALPKVTNKPTLKSSANNELLNDYCDSFLPIRSARGW